MLFCNIEEMKSRADSPKVVKALFDEYIHDGISYRGGVLKKDTLKTWAICSEWLGIERTRKIHKPLKKTQICAYFLLKE